MKFFATAFLFLLVLSTRAQDTIPHNKTILYPYDSLIVDSIHITGNSKTKDNIILRELSFAAGDTLALESLQKKLILSKQQVINTSLFIEATVDFLYKTSNHIVVNVMVKERWYLLPVPYFRLVDRNFNQWWTEQHRSLSRVTMD